MAEAHVRYSTALDRLSATRIAVNGAATARRDGHHFIPRIVMFPIILRKLKNTLTECYAVGITPSEAMLEVAGAHYPAYMAAHLTVIPTTYDGDTSLPMLHSRTVTP